MKFIKKITFIIIFLSLNVNAFGAVSSLVGQKNWGTGEQRQPTGVIFNPDGTKMYSTGTVQNKIYMYNLTTPYTVTSATYSSKTCNLTGDNDALMFRFNSDGTAIFVIGHFVRVSLLFKREFAIVLSLLPNSAWNADAIVIAG